MNIRSRIKDANVLAQSLINPNDQLLDSVAQVMGLTGSQKAKRGRAREVILHYAQLAAQAQGCTHKPCTWFVRTQAEIDRAIGVNATFGLVAAGIARLVRGGRVACAVDPRRFKTLDLGPAITLQISGDAPQPEALPYTYRVKALPYDRLAISAHPGHVRTTQDGADSGSVGCAEIARQTQGNQDAPPSSPAPLSPPHTPPLTPHPLTPPTFTSSNKNQEGEVGKGVRGKPSEPVGLETTQRPVVRIGATPTDVVLAADESETVYMPPSCASPLNGELWAGIVAKRRKEQWAPIDARAAWVLAEAMERAGAKETTAWLRRRLDDRGRIENLPGGSVVVRGLVDVPMRLDEEPFLDAWREWERHLVAKGCKITPFAARMQLRKLINALDGDPVAAERCVRRSIQENWRGLFPDREKDEVGGSAGGQARARTTLTDGHSTREMRRMIK